MRNSKNYSVGGNISLRRIKQRMSEERKPGGGEREREREEKEEKIEKIRFSTG